MENEDNKNKLIQIAKDLLDKIGFDGEIRFIDNSSGNSNFPTLSIESENDLSMLIGKGGQNLQAFEHLVRLVAMRKLTNPSNGFNFVVDINDYRKSRAGYLVDLAKNVAQKVIQTQKAEALSPMNSYERKLIHIELASYKEIQTESVGQEPHRRIVVKPQLE